MAISFVSNAGAAATTVAMPSHTTNDTILATVFTGVGTTTAPTVPGGWTLVKSDNSTASTFLGVYKKVAASGSETTGTWTGANAINIDVYRGVDSVGTNATANGSSVNGSTIIYPAITLGRTDSTSWVFRVAYVLASNISAATAPAGYTGRGGVNASSIHSDRIIDSNGGLGSSPGTLTQTGGTGKFSTLSIELLEPVTASTGTIAAAEPAATAGLNSAQEQTGTVTATEARATAAATGAQAQTGVMGAVMRSLTASMAGGQGQSGLLTASAARAQAAVTGTSIDNPAGSLSGSVVKLALSANATDYPHYSSVIEEFNSAIDNTTVDWYTSDISQAYISGGQAVVNQVSGVIHQLVTIDFPVGTVPTYSLENDVCVFRIDQAPSAVGNLSYVGVGQVNAYSWLIGFANGQISGIYNDGSHDTGLDLYDPAVHPYVRFRQTAGTVYFEKSTNGSTWTYIGTGGGWSTAGLSTTDGVINILTFDQNGNGGQFKVGGVNSFSTMGTLSSTVRNATAGLTGQQPFAGTMVAAAQRATAAMAGGQGQSGSVAAALVKSIASLTGLSTNDVIGSMNGTVQRATGALAGNQPFTAVVSAALQKSVATFSGAQTVSSTVGVALQRGVFSGIGTETFSGIMGVVLRPVTSQLTASQFVNALMATTLIPPTFLGREFLGIRATIRNALFGGLLQVLIPPPLSRTAAVKFEDRIAYQDAELRAIRMVEEVRVVIAAMDARAAQVVAENREA